MTLFPGPNVPRIKTSAPLYRGCISLLFLLSHSLSLSFLCVTKASLYVSFISSLLIVRDRRGAAVKLAGNKKKKTARSRVSVAQKPTDRPTTTYQILY